MLRESKDKFGERNGGLIFHLNISITHLYCNSFTKLHPDYIH